jgi:hypothetical protein
MGLGLIIRFTELLNFQTTCDYNVQITVTHSLVFYVTFFISCCLVASFNGGRFLSSYVLERSMAVAASFS